MHQTPSDRIQRHLLSYGVELRESVMTESSGLKTSRHLVELVRGSQSEQVILVTLDEMTVSALTANVSHSSPTTTPLLVVGPRITERSAHAFRVQGINYVDFAGNAFIRFGETLVDVRGRAPLRDPVQPKLTPGPKKSPFTTRRSQVLFALLAWPQTAHRPIQQIARYSGVSPGLVHDTIQILVERGFMTDTRSREILRRDELIDLWASEYPSGLGSYAHESKFYGDPHSLKTVGDITVHISGEAAVPELLRYQTLTVYVSAFDKKLIAANRWRRADGDANIFVRPQFWVRPPFDSAGMNDPTAKLLNAPELLIYADLLASQEPRQVETAEEFRRHHALHSTA